MRGNLAGQGTDAASDLPAASAADFSERLAQQVAEMARKAVEEHNRVLVGQLAVEREALARLRKENAQLFSELQQSKRTEPPNSSRTTQTPDTIFSQQQEPDAALAVPQRGLHNQGLATARRTKIRSTVFPRNSKNVSDMVGAKFQELDGRDVGRLCAADLTPRIRRDEGILNSQEFEQTVSQAIAAFNQAKPELCPSGGDQHELSLEAFSAVILADDLEDFLDPSSAAIMTEIRRLCVKDTAMNIIAEKTMISTQALTGKLEPLGRDCLHRLDALSGVVICLNAVILGVQLDVKTNWIGWDVFEITFTCFFCLELLLKVCYLGPLETFLGENWQWNQFDLVVIVFAAIDAIFTLGRQLGWDVNPNLQSITIFRLFRLLRVARLVRVLKMSFFKDLTVMINGVVGGLRTLFWAFVLLFFIIYVIGVLVRQLVSQGDNHCTFNDPRCTDSQVKMAKDTDALFSTLPRSMFTVFRCFTDGCNTMDGTPLPVLFWDVYGVAFILVYILVFAFVTFGVFNIIVAVFVEKTLQYAKLDSDKRRDARYREDVRVAKELQQVVLRICAHQHEHVGPERKTTQTRRAKAAGARGLMKLWKDSRKHRMTTFDSSDSPVDLKMQVNRDDFDEIINEPDVRSILEDMEVPVTNSSKLFDILDSNNSGTVDVAELADGLLKLRGPADKGDLISASLMVRACQKTLTEIKAEQQGIQKALFQMHAGQSANIDMVLKKLGCVPAAHRSPIAASSIFFSLMDTETAHPTMRKEELVTV